MARNWNQGTYFIKNPAKYLGKNIEDVTYRSAWELTMMRLLDEHPNVVGWASECMAIPYYNPLLRKWTEYVPDFLAIYEDKHGKRHGVVYEVKPSSQALLSEARSDRDRAHVAVNMMKWKAAKKFCEKRGLRFEVLTEDAIYANTRRSRRSRHAKRR